MSNRLSKIVTRTGDAGETGLGTGTRISKDSPRIDALGDIDELNSCLGVLLAEPLPEAVRLALLGIQHDLFDLGGELSIPTMRLVSAEQVEKLDGLTESFNADLAPLKEFILPGGTRPAALAHLCRTICRRAERSVVHLAKGFDGSEQAESEESVSPSARQYLNRLSDLLFILGRALNQAGGQGDVLWQHERKKK